MKALLALIGILFAAFSLSAKAQSEIHYTAAQRVDPAEVARILTAPKARTIKTRSLRLLDDAAAAAAPPAAAGEAPSSLSIPVRFAFDSADILPQARPQLDAIAAGIKLLPAGQAIVVEGHTDARGPDHYNVTLSHRRAEAVRKYLARVHGIDESRLAPVGFGEHRPISGIDPFAGENRRVQFRSG